MPTAYTEYQGEEILAAKDSQILNFYHFVYIVTKVTLETRLNAELHFPAHFAVYQINLSEIIFFTVTIFDLL